jgi:hypothetical protein
LHHGSQGFWALRRYLEISIGGDKWAVPYRGGTETYIHFGNETLSKGIYDKRPDFFGWDFLRFKAFFRSFIHPLLTLNGRGIIIATSLM